MLVSRLQLGVGVIFSLEHLHCVAAPYLMLIRQKLIPFLFTVRYILSRNQKRVSGNQPEQPITFSKILNALKSSAVITDDHVKTTECTQDARR